jgi:two-component system LytT family response regulator
MNFSDFPQNSTHQLLLNTATVVKLVNHHQILFIEADDNYSRIYLENQTEFRLSKTLGVIEDEINNEMFFRCHRTYLVNVFFIKEISKGDDMSITLKNGSKIPLARRRLGNLRRLIIDQAKSVIYSK